MYAGDHAPPHFHAEYAEYDAMYEIETLEVYAGELPGRINRLVLQWAELHRDELRNNWELSQSGQQPVKIEPLK